jgi:tetratricopeptide (TPR) repeat protein
MKKLISELRDRGVIRVAGLYVAVTWLVLQISDVVFPAFDIPDSTLRYIVFAAVGGAPLVLIFAWFFEFTSEGIQSEAEIRESGAERAGGGLLSIFTIVALVLALGVSLFVNFQQASDAPVVEPNLVSILVADFTNRTGDPVFDGSLEAALTIGIEGASFISSFARHTASLVAEKITSIGTLNEESARLVSVREGIDLVLAGDIVKVGNGYKLTQRVIDPVAGELVAEASASASDKADVLPAVGALAAQIREALGDVTLKDGTLASNETFTAASIEAVHNYTMAQTFAHKEQNVEAIEYYQKAVAEDPAFGRAYSGWALSEMKLGRMEKADELWKKTLTLVDGMTERERYRTLGVYYLTVSANYTRAIENHRLLVEKYPADGIGWSNLGMSYFYNLNFSQALEVGAELVRLYPSDPAFHANYALFAMYAGDFPVGRKEAETLLAEHPDYFLAYLPLAMSDLADMNPDAAMEVYRRMGAQGTFASSVAASGMADVALLGGDYAKASTLLVEGRAADIASGNSRGATHKAIYLATTEAALGNKDAAITLLDEVLPQTDELSHLLPAALLLIQLDEIERALGIQKMLGARLQAGSRAGADLIIGEIALHNGEPIAAVDAFNKSLERLDSWLGRLALGRAYSAAGYHAEALGELELCDDRVGEATALFLDDIPTFHYHAPLYYWLGRSKMELGMLNEARENLEKYLAIRVGGDTTANTEDARALLAKLAE